MRAHVKCFFQFLHLNGCSLAVVRDAVPDDHVELVLLVLDPKHHGHRLTDLDNPTHLARPRTFAGLNLHPALKVVAQEVGRDRVEHVDLERPERDGLFVIVVPCASKLPGLIPNLLNQRIILQRVNGRNIFL